MKIKRYVVLRKRRFFVLGKNDAFTEIGIFGIRSKSLSLAGHTFNVLRLLADHLMRSETSRFSRETFRFSWSLSSFAETFRFSKPLDFSLSLWPATHSLIVQLFGQPTTLIYCAVFMAGHLLE